MVENERTKAARAMRERGDATGLADLIDPLTWMYKEGDLWRCINCQGLEPSVVGDYAYCCDCGSRIVGNLDPETVESPFDSWSVSLGFDVNSVLPAGERELFSARFAGYETDADAGECIRCIREMGLPLPDIDCSLMVENPRGVDIADSDLLLAGTLCILKSTHQLTRESFVPAFMKFAFSYKDLWLTLSSEC